MTVSLFSLGIIQQFQNNGLHITKFLLLKFLIGRILVWAADMFLSIYQCALKSARDNPNEVTKTALNEIAETKEKVELKLQKSRMLLT